MARYWIRFTGRVQGVGFRYFVSGTARLHGLTGYVRNIYDGSVESEVQGDEDAIMAFLRTVRAGNGYSDVRNLDMREISELKAEYGFVID